MSDTAPLRTQDEINQEYGQFCTILGDKALRKELALAHIEELDKEMLNLKVKLKTLAHEKVKQQEPAKPTELKAVEPSA